MDIGDAYRVAAASWPAGTASVTVDTTWGRTHLLTAGPPGAPPLLLLHGGGATAVAWAGVAGRLAGGHRLWAPDQPGDPGPSTVGRRLRTTADQCAWLGELLDGCVPGPVHLVGHSAGGHLALTYALAHPDRVATVTLLDPTACFAGISRRYLLRALPMLLRPTEERVRRFFAWETGGRPLPAAWLDLVVAGATGPVRVPMVRPRRPGRTSLAGCTVPTLVLVAGAGRQQDPARVRQAAAVLPRGTVHEVAAATHHTLPVLDVDEVARTLAAHVAGELPPRPPGGA